MPTSAWRASMALVLSAWLSSGFGVARVGAQEMSSHGRATSPARTLAGSVHASLGCRSCHAEGEMEGSGPGSAMIAEAACSRCHVQQEDSAGRDQHRRERISGNAQSPTCVTCHGSHDVLPRTDPRSRSFPANVAGRCASCHDPTLREYLEGVHATVIAPMTGEPAATCATCHAPHDVRRADDPASGVSPPRVARTCGACHAQARAEYDMSVHAAAVARGSTHAPSCVSCHASHAIPATRADYAPTSPQRISATCSGCHGDVRLADTHRLPVSVVTDFRSNFHGLAGRLGDRRVANCASCHGAHEIRPSWDPQSRVHPANIPQTCGSCHAGVTSGFARGGIHHAPATLGHRAVDVVRSMYATMIVVVVALMGLHNGLDFARRWRERKVRIPLQASGAATHSGGTYPRFSLNERTQHWVLATSFITLVITGFALKFGWSLPWVPEQAGAIVRAWGHRVAAVVFIGLAVYHVGYLVFTRRGRDVAREMWPTFERRANIACCIGSCLRMGPPSVSDWRDLVQTLRYNLGWTHERPRFGRFSYAEKMEYFALVWGTLVMAVTGAILWFEVPYLNRLPFWSFDLATVVHLYEAILATLAIVVWHFYFTIFNPDVFPLSRTMITGTIGREEMEREHARELDELERRDHAPRDAPEPR